MDKDKKITHDIFVDLDAIMDTRLPILYAIDETTAINGIQTNMYYKRLKDVFGVISYDIFTALYNNRDKGTLLASNPSYLFDFLLTMIVEIKTMKLSLGEEKSLNIYLNIYPYELSIDEQNNLIIAIENMVSDITVIPVRMDNSEIGPLWISSRVGTIIKYDGLKWLEYHTAMGNLYKASMPDVTLIVPALASGNIKLKDISQDTFNTLMVTTSTIIDLKMLPVKQFCLKPKEKK